MSTCVCTAGGWNGLTPHTTIACRKFQNKFHRAVWRLKCLSPFHPVIALELDQCSPCP